MTASQFLISVTAECGDERSITDRGRADGFNRRDDTARLRELETRNADIIPFPLDRRRPMACPQCGKHSDVKQVGRLTWAYCETHAVRWVVADRRAADASASDRRQLRRAVEFLSAFTEISVS